ncbi:MAG TPA: hypothetical protein VN397_04220 [Candidatus Methylomirabilis sp.]|nr:hypothetical protein [Candidatus Methylomirabilis sp.]
MDTDHRPLLSRLPFPETPPSLYERVMHAIDRARTSRLRARFALAVSGFVVSIGAAVASWSAVWTELRESSFVDFVRLAASDPDIVFMNAKDLLLGLAETIPLGTVLLVLLVAFCGVGVAAFADAWRDLRRTRFIHYSSITN